MISIIPSPFSSSFHRINFSMVRVVDTSIISLPQVLGNGCLTGTPATYLRWVNFRWCQGSQCTTCWGPGPQWAVWWISIRHLPSIPSLLSFAHLFLRPLLQQISIFYSDDWCCLHYLFDQGLGLAGVFGYSLPSSAQLHNKYCRHLLPTVVSLWVDGCLRASITYLTGALGW